MVEVALAELLAERPRLVERHVDDGTGRCAGCGLLGPRWPCAVLALAARPGPARVSDGMAVAVLASGMVEVVTDAR